MNTVTKDQIHPTPLVSVVMPAYNSRAFIADSIRSVLEQDYDAIELIVVDDGSSDGTPEIARSFGDRVQVLEQKNAGPAAARNRGVAEARGEFIAFIDSDDIWLPQKTRLQVQYLLKHDSVGVVFGRLVRWFADADGTFPALPDPPNVVGLPGIVEAESGWIYPEMLLDSVIWIVSAMVRKSLWNDLGGLDEGLRIGEDYDFFIRASRRCRMDELDMLVAYYRIHNQSTTQVIRNENYECMVLLRSIVRFGTVGTDGREVSRPLLQERLFMLHFNHGYRHYRWGNPCIATRAFLSALIQGRRVSWRAMVYFLLSFTRCLGKKHS